MIQSDGKMINIGEMMGKIGNIFTVKNGAFMIQFDLRICFNWVGSTTNAAADVDDVLAAGALGIFRGYMLSRQRRKQLGGVSIQKPMRALKVFSIFF